MAVSGSSTVYLSDLFREYFIKVFSQFCSLKSLTKKGKIIENTMVGISITKRYPRNYDSEDPWWFELFQLITWTAEQLKHFIVLGNILASSCSLGKSNTRAQVSTQRTNTNKLSPGRDRNGTRAKDLHKLCCITFLNNWNSLREESVFTSTFYMWHPL